MAQVTLNIVALDAADLLKTVMDIARSGMSTAVIAPAAIAAAESLEPAPVAETPAQAEEAGKRTRRTKAEMEAARSPQAAASALDTDSPSTDSQTEASSNETARPAASQEGEAATFESVTEATTKWCSPDGGKGSMKQARDLLREHFVTADGQPVDRLSTLQPKDFAAYIALLK